MKKVTTPVTKGVAAAQSVLDQPDVRSETLADRVGVGITLIRACKFVLKHKPKLLRQVASGDVTIWDARDDVRRMID